MAETKKGSSCGVIFVVIVIICVIYACNSGSSLKTSNDTNKVPGTEKVSQGQSQFVDAFSGILKSGYKFHTLYTTKSKDFNNVYIIGGIVEKMENIIHVFGIQTLYKLKTVALQDLPFRLTMLPSKFPEWVRLIK